MQLTKKTQFLRYFLLSYIKKKEKEKMIEIFFYHFSSLTDSPSVFASRLSPSGVRQLFHSFLNFFPRIFYFSSLDWMKEVWTNLTLIFVALKQR